jgi:hypothetical protein
VDLWCNEQRTIRLRRKGIKPRALKWCGASLLRASSISIGTGERRPLTPSYLGIRSWPGCGLAGGLPNSWCRLGGFNWPQAEVWTLLTGVGLCNSQVHSTAEHAQRSSAVCEGADPLNHVCAGLHACERRGGIRLLVVP